jgi:CheY-like chemotaxis protein
VSVLVVDDECDARTLIQRFLQECDAKVFTAASAVEAMHVLLHESPTVLVSDIGMPGEDGYELMRRIRLSKDVNARIPAVALTAYARVEDRVRAVQAGYQLHLSKPVKPIELIAMVDSLAKGSSCQSG